MDEVHYSSAAAAARVTTAAYSAAISSNSCRVRSRALHLLGRTRTTHHDRAVAERHRRMTDLAVGPRESIPFLGEAERLREPIERSAYVLVQQVGCDAGAGGIGLTAMFCSCVVFSGAT